MWFNVTFNSLFFCVHDGPAAGWSLRGANVLVLVPATFKIAGKRHEMQLVVEHVAASEMGGEQNISFSLSDLRI